MTGYTLDPDATEIIGEKARPFLRIRGTKGICRWWAICMRRGSVSTTSFEKAMWLRLLDRKDFIWNARNGCAGKVIRHYRADSASYQAELFNQLRGMGSSCDHGGQDKAVKKAIAGIKEMEWKEPVRGCGYALAETVHCMEKTKEAFRLVIKREVRRQGELFEKKEKPYFIMW